ncbi:MAG: hypothetical protein ACYS1B_16015 [Planctomycetota bacterium]
MEKREAHLGREVLRQAVLHPEELSRPVGRLAQRHDAGVADHGLERPEIIEPVPRLGGVERDGVGPEPCHRLEVGLTRGGRGGGEGDGDRNGQRRGIHVHPSYGRCDPDAAPRRSCAR